MKQAIFLIGLPAAGKSTIARERFGGSHLFLDCDAIKATHPDYDPKDPAPLHDWSKQVLAGQFDTVLAGTDSFVYDSTGTDWQAMAGNMTAARLAGFETILYFVTCNLAESLRRNAKRSRNVPEHIVIGKAETITGSFDTLAPMADNVFTIDNSARRD